MNLIKTILSKIDDDIRFERMWDKLYNEGLEDKELYEEATNYVGDNLTEYKDVRIEGCFGYGPSTHIRISYKSVFGLRFNKDIAIYTEKSVRRCMDTMLNDDKLNSNYSLWERCFNDK